MRDKKALEEKLREMEERLETMDPIKIQEIIMNDPLSFSPEAVWMASNYGNAMALLEMYKVGRELEKPCYK